MERLYTIGYGNRHPKEFWGLIVLLNIDQLVDVRRNPDTAWNYAYTRLSMLKTSERYRTAIRLGNPYHSLDEFDGYFLDNETGSAYKDEIERLYLSWQDDGIEIPCLMCAELDYKKCHRKYIADYLSGNYGVKVAHL